MPAEFGKGYSETALRSFRLFYLTFNDLQIQQTLSANSIDAADTIPDIFNQNGKGQTLPLNLSWSHYERLIRVADLNARQWYMQEAVSQQWDYRTLKRNIDSQYYHRLLQTPEVNRDMVVGEMFQLNADYQAAMRASTTDARYIKSLLLPALTDDISSREMFMKGIDYSYYEQVDQ